MSKAPKKTLFSVCEAKNPHTVQYAIDERTKKKPGETYLKFRSDEVNAFK